MLIFQAFIFRAMGQKPYPKFKVPTEYLFFASITSLCQLLCKKLIKDITKYSEEFSSILMRHFTNEVEINLVAGCITAESDQKLDLLESEWNILQYKSKLHLILEPWESTLTGQPLQEGVANEIR